MRTKTMSVFGGTDDDCGGDDRVRAVLAAGSADGRRIPMGTSDRMSWSSNLPSTYNWGDRWRRPRLFGRERLRATEGILRSAGFPSTNQHPVIAQNLYRVTLPDADPPVEHGKIEMLGISWLKNGFVSVNTSAVRNLSCNPPWGIAARCWLLPIHTAPASTAARAVSARARRSTPSPGTSSTPTPIRRAPRPLPAGFRSMTSEIDQRSRPPTAILSRVSTSRRMTPAAGNGSTTRPNTAEGHRQSASAARTSTRSDRPRRACRRSMRGRSSTRR